MARLHRRLAPVIRKAYQYDPTRIERHIVARYDALEGGFFKAHRDNTTKGTAHRKFAVTINLNAEDYEGGDLRVPEFGQQGYRAPTGGAVVFSCSLLHEALPGSRFEVIPRAGRVAMVDRPAVFNALLLDFLNGGEDGHSS